jgi:hypothetical protein
MSSEQEPFLWSSHATIVTDDSPDVQRIVEVLDRHQFDYLVVGGMAATLQGATRPTLDSDCLAKRSDENADEYSDRTLGGVSVAFLGVRLSETRALQPSNSGIYLLLDVRQRKNV